jgi:hypothetical protein
MWLVDSDVAGIWQAEAGYNYEVKSSEEYYSSGTWNTREKIETRVRWEPRTGQLQRHYDNVAVAATSDFQVIQNAIGGFDYNQGQSYHPEDLEHAILRVPDIHPDSAWSEAQNSLNRLAAHECQMACNAQHLREYSIEAQYKGQHWTQLLLPVTLTWYTDDSGKRRIVYINGQNGRIGGPRLASQRKGWKWAGILIGIAAVLFIAGLVFAALGALFPPVVVLGVVLIVIALILGLVAIVPAVWPWQWNRKQADTDR